MRPPNFPDRVGMPTGDASGLETKWLFGSSKLNHSGLIQILSDVSKGCKHWQAQQKQLKAIIKVRQTLTGTTKTTKTNKKNIAQVEDTVSETGATFDAEY